MRTNRCRSAVESDHPIGRLFFGGDGSGLARQVEPYWHVGIMLASPACTELQRNPEQKARQQNANASAKDGDDDGNER